MITSNIFKVFLFTGVSTGPLEEQLTNKIQLSRKLGSDYQGLGKTESEKLDMVYSHRPEQ